MKILLIAFFTILLVTGDTFAHGDHHHTGGKDSAAMTPAEVHEDSAMQQKMEEHQQMEAIDAFPNYHPLVIHFPIVLLLLAAAFQLLSFFMYKKEFSMVTLILLALGVLSAWLASNVFHAHPGELTGRARDILETHEQMASATWWFSLCALLMKIVSHFFLDRKFWAEAVAIVFMIISAVTVSIAGHHGAMLVHMEGIGPMGKYLEGFVSVKANPVPHSMAMTKPENAKEENKPEGQEENHHVGEPGKGPHGGTIEEAEPYHIEIKAEGSDLIFYLLDGDAKPLSNKGITGNVKMHYADKSLKTISLMEMGGKLTAMQANNGQAFTAVCRLTREGKSYSASFDSAKDLQVKK